MKNNVSHMLEKAGLTGLATLGMGCAFLGCGQAKWLIPGTQTLVPVEVMTFSVGLANSFVTDGIHQLLHKAIPLGKKTADRASLVSNAVVSGISFYALLHLAGTNIPFQYTPIRAFATGAVGELAGNASYEYLVNNMYI